MDEHKKLILLDLDGVINTYNGNFDKNFIPEIKEEIYLKTTDKTSESLKIKRNNEDINIKNNENEDLI